MQKHSSKLALPFFLVLALLTILSMIIPLRPTISYAENRDLEKFPEFSVEALVSGDYFDQITLWFSDTFPGRERWISLSQSISSLYGHSYIAIAGPLEEPTPQPSPELPEEAPDTALLATAQTEPEESTAATETGPAELPQIDVGDIYIGNAVQIGDAGFNQLKISTIMSEKYAKTISDFADRMAPKGVRVISAPAPTSVGVMVDEQYLSQLNCSPQDEMLDYMHQRMSDNVLKVDTVRKLQAHRDEYIYYRTDHHWSALGAYYAYQALCEAAGMEAVPLEEMDYQNQGTMIGSIYGKVPYPKKLKKDEMECWRPRGAITMYLGDGTSSEFPLIRDVSNQKAEGKYCAFLGSDQPIVHIVNEDLPDGPSCLVVKDSFGNCFVPYLSQNYHHVYAIDYRKYWDRTMENFAEQYDIDDVIIAPYMIATQVPNANEWFQKHFR